MKHRCVTLFVSLILAFLFALSCTSGAFAYDLPLPEDEVRTMIESHLYSGFVHIDSGEVIYVGMPVEDAEKILGPMQESLDYYESTYAGGMEMDFTESSATVKELTLHTLSSQKFMPVYETVYGIQCGMLRQDLEACFDDLVWVPKLSADFGEYFLTEVIYYPELGVVYPETPGAGASQAYSLLMDDLARKDPTRSFMELHREAFDLDFIILSFRVDSGGVIFCITIDLHAY